MTRIIILILAPRILKVYVLIFFAYFVVQLLQKHLVKCLVYVIYFDFWSVRNFEAILLFFDVLNCVHDEPIRHMVKYPCLLVKKTLDLLILEKPYFWLALKNKSDDLGVEDPNWRVKQIVKEDLRSVEVEIYARGNDVDHDHGNCVQVRDAEDKWLAKDCH